MSEPFNSFNYVGFESNAWAVAAAASATAAAAAAIHI